jgi:hypothetical protein
MSTSFKDSRVIDLRENIEDIRAKLPSWFDTFIQQPDLNLLLSAGDGVRSSVSDIEKFSKLSTINHRNKAFQIFSCLYNYNKTGLQRSYTYLQNNPNLQVLLILADVTNSSEMEKLQELLYKSVDYIGTDDRRSYIPAETAHKILKDEGKVADFDIRRTESYLARYNDEDLFEASGPFEFKKVDSDKKYAQVRENLQYLDNKYRTNFKIAKNKLSNCTSDSECLPIFGKNGHCNMETKHCEFDTNGGKKGKRQIKKQRQLTKKHKRRKRNHSYRKK